MTTKEQVKIEKKIATQCEICGEPIPRPVPRKNGEIKCSDCAGDRFEVATRTRSGCSDRQYHGGMFTSGEW